MHHLIASSASLSVPGNQTFSLMHCVVLMIPWRAWCAVAMTFCGRLARMTRRCPQRYFGIFIMASLNCTHQFLECLVSVCAIFHFFSCQRFGYGILHNERYVHLPSVLVPWCSLGMTTAVVSWIQVIFSWIVDQLYLIEARDISAIFPSELLWAFGSSQCPVLACDQWVQQNGSQRGPSGSVLLHKQLSGIFYLSGNNIVQCQWGRRLCSKSPFRSRSS